MKVKRIVVNIETQHVAAAKLFYKDVLGLDVLMDHGWIATYGSDEQQQIQIGFASQGGNDTPVPYLSIEVDDLDVAHENIINAGFVVEYGPVSEPWGVKRFYTRDPFGKLINVLQHL